MNESDRLQRELRILRRKLERSELNRQRLEAHKDRSEAFHRRIIQALEETKHELRLEKQTAERLARAKDELLANVSHDLRTPMTGILGIADMLQRAPLGAQETEWVGILTSSARGLLTLLDDLLDLTKLDVGRLRLVEEPFDPADLLHRQIALVKAEAVDRGLRLELAVDPTIPEQVLGDPARVRQVLLNLLSNALRYTKEGGIEVRLEKEDAKARGAGDPPRLRVEVRDTGKGIPEAHLEEIFGLFFQEDSEARRRNEGSGLGLAISRRLARALGGDISVQSRVGIGSTFTFTFVAPVSHGSSERLPRSAVSDLSGLRVLLVEDNPVNRLVVAAQLQSLGATVDAVEDGEAAIEATSDTAWDLVLMDCHLPGIDGSETTRRIRAREASTTEPSASRPVGTAEKPRRVPILALTASVLENERKRCLDAGMDGFLAKPSQPAEILAAIHQVLERSQRSQERVAPTAPLSPAGDPATGRYDRVT